MRFAVFVITGLLLAACTSEQPPSENSDGDAVQSASGQVEVSSGAVAISNPVAQEQVTPVMEEGVLVLGDTRIDNWQGAVPKCSACRLKVERRMKPDGPDTLLSLVDGGEERWALMDIRHRRVFLGEWSVTFDEDQRVSISRDEKTLTLKPGEQGDLAGCTTRLLHAEEVTGDEKSGVASESPVVRAQIVRQCPGS